MITEKGKPPDVNQAEWPLATARARIRGQDAAPADIKVLFRTPRRDPDFSITSVFAPRTLAYSARQQHARIPRELCLWYQRCSPELGPGNRPLLSRDARKLAVTPGLAASRG